MRNYITKNAHNARKILKIVEGVSIRPSHLSDGTKPTHFTSNSNIYFTTNLMSHDIYIHILVAQNRFRILFEQFESLQSNCTKRTKPSNNRKYPHLHNHRVRPSNDVQRDREA